MMETNILNHILTLPEKATSSFLLKVQIQALASLAGTCKMIRLEFLSEFFCQSQIYPRHESFSPQRDCGCYIKHYQRGLDMLIMNPLLAKDTTNVYWAMLLQEDLSDHKWTHQRGVRFYEPDFIKVYEKRPWPLDTVSFVMGLPNLTTLHIDVEFVKDWGHLKEWSWKKGFILELWRRPTMKKMTLRLTFMGAHKAVKKAFKSRFVRRGRPESRLTRGNILNYLLTLPEDYYKDVPSGVIQRHFGYMNPRWPRLERF
ncbi:hypothetical protein B0T20DRAFT_453317 [Sordaria brevicollis]|uniref:Uncharacterized protein n=1 Tax=Sordaria brevicollis TaxID=83679 RepID=A0AAE0PES2_SORBR|nr:hypothetical protein B0T20DRAFT_453317 [Sordaria brevicollis]